MARYFDRDDLLEVCPIEQSLLYTYLRNLQERRLLDTDGYAGAHAPQVHQERFAFRPGRVFD